MNPETHDMIQKHMGTHEWISDYYGATACKNCNLNEFSCLDDALQDIPCSKARKDEAT